MKVSVDPAQGSDGEALAELYRGNHRLAEGRLRAVPSQGAQTFVARGEGRIVGMSLMTYFDDGVHRYGILHVLEVDTPPADYAPDVTIALVDACRDWLRKLGTDYLLAAPQLDAPTIVDRARRLRTIGEEQFRSDPEPRPDQMAPRVT